MNPRQRVDAAFEQALEYVPAERSGFLAALRESDPEIADEVEQLLHAHELGVGMLERPAPRHQPLPAEERRIGPYRVVRELGRGGMGVVYLAERDDGQFRRRVAVKLLRNTPDAEELHDRFIAERQILASLDHPNIAQLIDGGVTDGRLPYLVMEYVEGWPITEYCGRHRLGVAERLRLFQDVCAAVHHAHSNLIIHRDLKPGNILVTQNGQVKLLDFGIAKLINPGLSAMAAPVTWTSYRVLTPEYASPEQLRGEPLSTTSDIYVLGAVLYELLAGCRPHAVPGTTLPELLTRISEHEPERPSSACLRDPDNPSGEANAVRAAAARNATPEQLARALRGDIDAIVLMALRKEPKRRYGSADLLAQDIQRYLDGLPVLAHRGSRWYYTRKFVRRHRLAVSAAVIGAFSLIGGAGIAVRQTALARSESNRTQQALREAEEVTDFLVAMFEINDPEQLRGREVTARDLLRRGTQRAEELRAQPIVQARMLEVIGRVYSGLGDYAQARTLMERALTIREVHFGPDHLDVAFTLEQLAQIMRMQSRYPDAYASAERALDIRTRVLGPDHPDVAPSLVQVATMAVFLADLDGALELNRRAVAVQEKAYGATDRRLVPLLINLGSVLGRRGLYDQAEPHLRRAIEIARLAGEESAELAGALLSLAYTLHNMPGRATETESLYRQGVEMRRSTLGEDHPLYASAIGDLSGFLREQGRVDEALAGFRQQIELETRLFGPEHPRLENLRGAYAVTLHAAGRSQEAVGLARASVEERRRTRGTDHVSYANALFDLALILSDVAEGAEADSLMREVIEIRRRSAGRESGLVAIGYAALGRIQRQAGRFTDAEQQYLQALRIYEQLGILPAQRDHRQALIEITDLYERALGDSAAAARYRRLLASGSSS